MYQHRYVKKTIKLTVTSLGCRNNYRYLQAGFEILLSRIQRRRRQVKVKKRLDFSLRRRVFSNWLSVASLSSRLTGLFARTHKRSILLLASKTQILCKRDRALKTTVSRGDRGALSESSLRGGEFVAEVERCNPNLAK